MELGKGTQEEGLQFRKVPTGQEAPSRPASVEEVHKGI